jgi:5-methylcytosine-specific restriction endonuclease McrA
MGRKRRERIRRRHLEKTIAHEPYTMVEVANWSSGRCALCGLMVDMSAKVPDPMAPTIDHKLPLAHGGHDVRANVQLAHFICNCIKRDKVA